MKKLIFILVIGFVLNLNAQDFTESYSKVQESVVPIFTESDQTFEAGGKVQRTSSEGLGTGSIISKSGLILTASHVINDAKKIMVQIGDKAYSAKIVRNSVNADVALIQLDLPPSDLKPLKLGNSDKTKIGEQVFVIGYPHGLGKTFTVGHIGGRHEQQRYFSKINEIEMFQTDASINSGNSGGPMFNMDGEIIGIVSSILTKSGGFEGVGFAATINVAKNQLINDGNLWVGLDAILITEELAAAFNIPAKGGLFVQSVVDKSPAYYMGLQGGYLPIKVLGHEIILGGDVILNIDGIDCTSEQEIEKARDIIKSKKNGDIVKLLIFREGMKKEVNWTIKRERLEF
jgi:serine protease Do